MYTPFSLVFPEESGRHSLSFQLKKRNPFGLKSGHYELHDIYPDRQTPPIYDVFLNLTNAHNEILATLYCQLDTEEQQLHLSLSDIHLQSKLAAEILVAVDFFFQQARGQSWADLLVNRAKKMQAKSMQYSSAAIFSQTLSSEDTHLLKSEVLDVASINKLSVSQQMLDELAAHRQQVEHKNKIIRFPLERCSQPEVDVHWLDLRLELMDLPQIWRQLRVPDNLSLTQLHALIQLSMGWQNIHLWRFVHSRGEYVSYQVIEHIWEDELDADKTLLQDVLARKGNRLDYEYDFGDSWYHVIKVEQRYKSGGVSQPVLQCLDGSGACPPEDCGGYFGYQELIKIRQKKRKNKHDKAYLQSFDAYDPLVFSCDAINHKLSQIYKKFNNLNF